MSAHSEFDYDWLNQDPLLVNGGILYSASGQSHIYAIVKEPHIDTNLYESSMRSFKDGSSYQQMVDPETGTKLGIDTLNPNAHDEPAVAVMPSWLADPKTLPGNENLYSLFAAQNPQRKTLIINTPAFGSDPLPKEVQQRMREEKTMQAAGELVARALVSHLGDGDDLPKHLSGNSSGGRYLTAIAGHMPVGSLDSLRLCDAPHENLRRLAPAFFIFESHHRTKQRAITNDPYGIIEKLPHQELLVQDLGFKGLMRKLVQGGAAQKYSEALVYGNGIEGFETDMAAALKQQPNLNVRYIAPRFSEVSPDPRKIRKMLGRLPWRGGQMGVLLTLPEASHAFDDSHPGKYVSLMAPNELNYQIVA